MIKCLKKIANGMSKLSGILALASVLALPMQKVDGAIVQTNSYQTGWNLNTTFYLDNQGITSTIRKASRVSINAANLSQGISNLNFYAAGVISINPQLYEFDTCDYQPIKGIKLGDNHSSSWHIESIENIGKWPNLFGADGLERKVYFAQDIGGTNYFYMDNQARVFNRDLYEVKLATTGETYTGFNLDFDLITEERNAMTNDLTPLWVIYRTDGTNNYVYKNRIWGIESSGTNSPINASTDDWDQDSMPNSFEATYCGNPTNLEAKLDEDKDGSINTDEYRAGTNPTNKNSVFQFLSLQNIPPEISWQGGLTNFYQQPITYSITRATNFSEANPWEILATNIHSRSFTDTNYPAEKASYRVNVETN